MSNNDENPENPDVSDKTTEEISFNFICDWFAEQFGHGWKRRLAKVAGVPESNVYSWIKAGRLPPWVQRVFKLLIETSRLRRNEKFVAKQITKFRQVGQVVEDGDGFAVYHSDEGVGKLVARSFRTWKQQGRSQPYHG